MTIADVAIAVASVFGIAILLFCVQLLYFGYVLSWTDERTNGLNYFGLSRENRTKFRQKLKFHAVSLTPFCLLMTRFSKFKFSNGTFRHGDVAGPVGSCNSDSFERAISYLPQENDIFVATQMKSGTTWMLQLVKEILERGTSTDTDSQPLNALSPWLESVKTVDVEDAPMIGTAAQSRRIIKTHLPAQLCPFSKEAKYIYVVRHPVSCFASCHDFIRKNTGAFAPSLDDCESWFTSDETMWFQSWPTHVAGWWNQYQAQSNVLWVRFEDMKTDLRKVIAAVAEFLDIATLNHDELQQIALCSSFEFMQANADLFEMQPPHVLQNTGQLFVSGKKDRFQDVPNDICERIETWSHQQLFAQGIGEDEFESIFWQPETARINKTSG